MYGAKAEDELYDVPGIERVTAYRLHQVMRDAVRAYAGDVPIGRIATSHSLRYGGATMMASAGFPQYLIAHYGGWTADSEALKRYVRPSDESIERVSRYMTDMALAQPSRLYIDDAITVHQSIAGNFCWWRRRRAERPPSKMARVAPYLGVCWGTTLPPSWLDARASPGRRGRLHGLPLVRDT